MKRTALIAAVAASISITAFEAQAKDFRFAAQANAASLDPHFFDHAFTQAMLSNVFEGLTRWDDKLELEPALALSWEQPTPTEWVFKLREGVTFHGGQPFTAADVVFSWDRARGPSSGYAGITAPVEKVEAIDDFTVKITTKEPYSILPRLATSILILDEEWAKEHGAEQSSNMSSGTHNYAAANANGTGPFKVTSFDPDAHLNFEAFDDWWDEKKHNLTKVTFQPIKNNATRVAALLSDQVDMIYPVPMADMARIESSGMHELSTETSEWVITLTPNQGEAPLTGASNLDKNPFADVRVREALFRAIDADAIIAQVMRGMATSTGLPIAPTTNGYVEELKERPAFDAERARQLLAEAGFADGFSFTLDCPNDRFLNDEAVCRALIPMFKRIGLNASLQTRPTTQHFTHLLNTPSDLYMAGWASAGLKDGHNQLSRQFNTRANNLGSANYSQASDPELDATIAELAEESDPAKRHELFKTAYGKIKDEWKVIPLYIQPSVWGVRNNIDMQHIADDSVRLWTVTVN